MPDTTNPAPDASDTAAQAPAAAPAPAPAPAPNFVSLDEACAAISRGDKRVELIGAFHFDQRSKRKLRGLESDYRAAYAVFATSPA